MVYLTKGFHKFSLVTQNALVAVAGLGRGILNAFETSSPVYKHSVAYHCGHNVLSQEYLNLVSLVVRLSLVLGEAREYSLPLFHNSLLVHCPVHSLFSLHC